MDEAKRKAFIGRLSKALGRTEVPEFVPSFDYSKGPQTTMYQGLTHEQIVDMFIEECGKVGTRISHATPGNLGEVILAEVKHWGGGKVIYPDSKEWQEYALDTILPKADTAEAKFVKWDPALGRDANIGEAQDANMGITFPMMGIAESGTIIQGSDVASGRSIGLLPITHIAVVKKSTIKPRMTQVMQELGKVHEADASAFLSNIVCISGPSNTADIELVRVVGVHGPINVSFILLEA